jgi:hypothetical protein
MWFSKAYKLIFSIITINPLEGKYETNKTKTDTWQQDRDTHEAKENWTS